MNWFMLLTRKLHFFYKLLYIYFVTCLVKLRYFSQCFWFCIKYAWNRGSLRTCCSHKRKTRYCKFEFLLASRNPKAYWQLTVLLTLVELKPEFGLFLPFSYSILRNDVSMKPLKLWNVSFVLCGRKCDHHFTIPLWCCRWVCWQILLCGHSFNRKLRSTG